MRLDDDLGIDSIKRVEILSALQERSPTCRLRRPISSARSGRSAPSRNSWAGAPPACQGRGPAVDAAPDRRSGAGSCWRRWPRRRGIRPRCSSWTCGSTTTWASTRSSASRSSPPSRSGSPICRRPAPSRSGRSAPCAQIVELLRRAATPAVANLSAMPVLEAPAADDPVGRMPARRGGREDGLSRRDARAGHAARRRPGDRLDQARRDPLRGAGPAARDAGRSARNRRARSGRSGEIVEFLAGPRTTPSRRPRTAERVGHPASNATDHHVEPRRRAPPAWSRGRCPWRRPTDAETVKLLPPVARSGSPTTDRR